jgi:ABC-type multidrug transport system fused ATPase/permease subunit
VLKAWWTVRLSLELLSKRDRIVIMLLIGLQLALALIDFVGVILIGLVAALSASAISGKVPSQVSGVIDRIGLGDLDVITLAVILAAIAGLLFITKSILSFLMMRRSYRFLANRQAIVSGKLVSLLLARSILHVQKRSSQETAYALTVGANAATIGVLGSGIAVATEIAVIVVVLVAMVTVDVFVAIFSVALFAFIAVALHRLLATWASKLGQASSNAEIASTVVIQESLRTYREVTVTGRRGFYVDRFQQLRWRAASVQADLQIMSQVPKYVFEIVLIVGAAALSVFQFYSKDVVAAVSVIAVFLVATSRMSPALLRLQAAILNIRSAGGAATATYSLARELLDADDVRPLDPEVIKRIESRSLDSHADFDAAVSVHDVTLVYPEVARPAINHVSLNIRKGSSVALVGVTGAGKSTLADLILGVLSPQTGHVNISGLPAFEAISRWPGALAYVPQEIAVINDTIRSNVAAGLPTEIISDERVWEALDRAQLGGYLRTQREGLDSMIGEHGVKLSGGQRQRLGLARALYTRPKLLILDEATSALDAETELAVSKALESLEGDVTLIIIAHRLATIRHCDQVAYLQDGNLLALGTFEEVRQQVPNFDRQAQLLGL